MLFVSYVEVVIVFGRVFLGALAFQNSYVLFFRRFVSFSVNLVSDSNCRTIHDLLSPSNSFLAPIFFAHFLRLRYFLSPPTRTAFAWVSAQLDHGTAHPSCPAIVKKGVNLARDLVRSFNSVVGGANQRHAELIQIFLRSSAIPNRCFKSRLERKLELHLQLEPGRLEHVDIVSFICYQRVIKSGREKEVGGELARDVIEIQDKTVQ